MKDNLGMEFTAIKKEKTFTEGVENSTEESKEKNYNPLRS